MVSDRFWMIDSIAENPRPTGQCVKWAQGASWGLITFIVFLVRSYFSFNPRAPGKGEISLPHRRAIFTKLKNEDKYLFSFRNCKKWCKKVQNAIISLSFPSYVNWQPPENRQCIGERGRREVAKQGFGSPQAVVYEWIRLSFCQTLVTYFQWHRHYCLISAQMKRGKWYYVYKPHPAVNMRGFINPIRRLGVNWATTKGKREREREREREKMVLPH